MSKVTRIGIICEDLTDYEALKVIIKSIIKSDAVGFKCKKGDGCSKIRSKCVAWAKDLSNRKCDMLLVVHDLDRRDYDELHKELTKKLSACAISNHIVSIPIEELEAWFTADPQGIKKSLNLRRTPRFSGLPETISSPKEKLEAEIFVCSGKEVEYQTTMNARIASHLDFALIRSRCPSFKLFHDAIIVHDYK